MYKIRPSTKFQKDLKKVQKRGYDISLLTTVLNILANGESLPQKYKDWLLIYEILDDELILYLTRTGTHSDLF